MSPQRIQRKRTKGWRMPEGAVYVGRPTRWGNPFPAVEGRRTRAEAVHRFAVHIAEMPDLERHRFITLAQLGLAGYDLACWCPLDEPCHADVLLEIANEGVRGVRMSLMGTFTLSAYCQCGASMTGSGAGDMAAVGELQSVWWSVHSGEGHGPATQREAANARKREARTEAKRIREWNR